MIKKILISLSLFVLLVANIASFADEPSFPGKKLYYYKVVNHFSAAPSVTPIVIPADCSPHDFAIIGQGESKTYSCGHALNPKDSDDWFSLTMYFTTIPYETYVDCVPTVLTAPGKQAEQFNVLYDGGHMAKCTVS